MPYKVGDEVLVPNSLIGRIDGPTAVSLMKVVEVGAGGTKEHLRSVLVSRGDDGAWVSTSHIHPRMGIYLVRVGDLNSETMLLDPLAKSLSHFFRLLVEDGTFNLVYLRTRIEFEQFWGVHHKNITHLLLLAHGRGDAVRFLGEAGPEGGESWLTGHGFSEIFAGYPPRQSVHVLSLSCATGRAAFSKTLSLSETCDDCAGPFNDVHGAIASQFTQTLFLEHLLHGRTWRVAFKRARNDTTGSAGFRLWREGQLLIGSP